MNVTDVRSKTLISLSLLALGSIQPHLACAAEVADARAAFAEWAKVTAQISGERNEWKREKELLHESLAVSRAELAELERQIEDLDASASARDEQRAELMAQIENAQETSDALGEILAQTEIHLREVLELLPTPFRADLEPLVARLPEAEEAENLSVSQRLQTIAGLLTQIDQFNSGLHVLSEIRTLPNGEEREVKTLYMGLGAAYFADASGTVAGYGAPGASGWEWKTAEGDTAARISRAIAIHENEAPPAFVSLPVEIN